MNTRANANDKRIKTVRRKLFSALTKAGIVVKEEKQYVTLDGVRAFVSIRAIGTFPPEGAALRMTFGSYIGARSQLSIREPKTGFKYDDIVPRFKTLIAQEKERMAIVRQNNTARENNVKLAKAVRQNCPVAEDSGIRIDACDYRFKGKVAVRVDVEVTPRIAARIVRAIQAAMA